MIMPALVLAVPAAAQDLSPVISTAEVARGQVVGATMKQHSQRIAAKRTSARATPNQVAACSKKEGLRREYGADNPRLQRLYSLCRSVGL